jgi:hypothetical protein
MLSVDPRMLSDDFDVVSVFEGSGSLTEIKEGHTKQRAIR